jgi:hypothetical protein
VNFQAFPEVGDFPRQFFFGTGGWWPCSGPGAFFQTHESFQTTHGRKTKQAQEEIPALVF